MTCAGCVLRVEEALTGVDGVETANVNLATERARVRYRGGSELVEAMYAAVRETGYEAIEAGSGAKVREEAEETAREAELQALHRRAVFAGIPTAVILALQMFPMLWPPAALWLHLLIGESLLLYILFALASIVQFGPGLWFYRLGWKAVRTRHPDMHTLVMLGSSAAYGYSLAAMFLSGMMPSGADHVYFEASSAIIALILLGKYLEVRVRGARRRSDAVASWFTTGACSCGAFRWRDGYSYRGSRGRRYHPRAPGRAIACRRGRGGRGILGRRVHAYRGAGTGRKKGGRRGGGRHDQRTRRFSFPGYAGRGGYGAGPYCSHGRGSPAIETAHPAPGGIVSWHGSCPRYSLWRF